MRSKTKKYSGEGRYVIEVGNTILTRPLWRLKSILLRLLGRRPKDHLKLNRDFYAALTSDQNYVIMGEARYGIASRLVTVKKPKSNATMKK